MAGKCGSEILLRVVEAMTFYSADMSFPPTPLRSDTQPLTAATATKKSRNKMSLGWLSEKSFLK